MKKSGEPIIKVAKSQSTADNNAQWPKKSCVDRNSKSNPSGGHISRKQPKAPKPSVQTTPAIKTVKESNGKLTEAGLSKETTKT